MRRRASIALTIAGVVATTSVGPPAVSLAGFTEAADARTTITAASSFDTVAPSIQGSAIAAAGGSISGFIHQGGMFQVYAQVVDDGAAASGVDVVEANVGAIATGLSNVPLVAGFYSVGGVAYGYRSATVTANATLAAGSIPYGIAASDAAGNSTGSSGFSVVVDNTQPVATNVQTANGGVTAGTPEAGDSITFTFSEPLDPATVLAGWTGASLAVVVRIADGGVLGNDILTVWDAGDTVQLALGSVDLGGSGYVPAARTFGASGTASTMTASGTTITIGLGTPSGATGGGPVLGANMTWMPSPAAFDPAGNASKTTPATESDGLFTDSEF